MKFAGLVSLIPFFRVQVVPQAPDFVERPPRFPGFDLKVPMQQFIPKGAYVVPFKGRVL